MTTDNSGDDYRYHAEKYYDRQWELLDDYLSDEHALLVKRVIREGEEQRDWAKSTARNHLRNIRFLIEFGVDSSGVPDDPRDWDADDWNRVVADLAIDRAVGSGQKKAYASAVKAFIWHCGELDDVSRHDIKSPKQKRSPIDVDNVLSHHEVIELIENANNSRDRALIATIYQGGLRREAAVQIDLGNYDDKGDWATIKIPDVEGVKGADGSVKPLTWAKGYIESWLSDHPFDAEQNPDEALFCSVRKQDDGKRVSGHSVYTMMKRLAESIDIDNDRIHPHMLKHARGTMMRESPNYDKKDIEQIMDWTESTPMHARYSHADEPAEAARVAQKMGIDVEEESHPEPIDCPRCARQVPASVTYCPHCSLKLDDTPADWYLYYRRIVPDDDPVVQHYEELSSITPQYSNLSKEMFEHVDAHFLAAVALADAKYFDDIEGTPSIDEYDWPDMVNIEDLSDDEIDDISERFVSPGEHLAENFRSNAAEYALEDNEFDLSTVELRELANEYEND